MCSRLDRSPAGKRSMNRTEEVFGTTAVISVIEALDRFLIAIVLLYFSYGVYALFYTSRRERGDARVICMASLRQIGQLKQVVAELIVVILFVLFLRQAIENRTAMYMLIAPRRNIRMDPTREPTTAIIAKNRDPTTNRPSNFRMFRLSS